MCTSMIVKAQDCSTLYGRTMEWGGFDLDSELVLMPRGVAQTSALTAKQQGMTWKNQYGFVAINPAKLPYVADGMNEAGLTVGVLYMPGFAHYQAMVGGKEESALNNADLAGYILGNFSHVEDIKQALPTLLVIENEDVAKQFGAPVPLHWIVADESGQSIVIEYVGGELQLHDNKIGVMTNSPGYDWHLLNLRNYPHLQAQDISGPREINGVNLAPFGVGSGMLGLPGDVTPPSRFVRAVAFVQTLLPFADAESGIQQIAHVLHNFDIPIGLVREGEHQGHIMAGQTQWSVIGDHKNRRYYYWTQHNRRMRLVNLSKLDFSGGTRKSIPLDREPREDIEDRTQELA